MLTFHHSSHNAFVNLGPLSSIYSFRIPLMWMYKHFMLTTVLNQPLFDWNEKLNLTASLNNFLEHNNHLI